MPLLTWSRQSACMGGGPLPMRCNPTTSKEPAPPPKPVSRQHSGKLDGRSLSGTGLKGREAIAETGAYERPQYIPGPRKNLDKEKQRLANYMAYGEDIPPITEQRKQEILRIQTPPPETDRFDELEAEIRERSEFLEDMRRLGKDKQYKAIISTEISQKVREMEIIDKQRTAQLQKALQLQQEPGS
ncbi:UPF0193 protein EVG1 homolog [Amphiura filiformis]|uniref:UPF0193 protein EVG1 homolog n=1 Tax=Amphiura filiformis TaxID=82378 RepID=UPI003B218385